MSDSAGFPAISDYAFLSDCHSLALVARDGSIEWAVFHRFDGRPVFARILDRDIGGFFRVGPTAPDAEVRRRYLPGTNVLETTFTTADGVVTLTDFMPVEPDPDEIGKAHRLGARHSLIRIVRGVGGSVEMEMAFHPRFEYGLTTPYITELADDLVVAAGSADALTLQSEFGPLPRDGRGGVQAHDRIEAGDERVIAITWSTPARLDTTRIDHAEAVSELDATVRFWERWSEHTRYEGPYREAVERSALAIKGLTDGRTGAVIAAATTSLPETIGGGRNWDYRYTWMRDTSTMLNALIRLGHDYECRRFSRWIRSTTAGRAEELQIMYGIGGERILSEIELGHLSGYRNSRPVRIGNGAWDQSQHDTYGWVLASNWFTEAYRGGDEPEAQHEQRFLDELIERAIAEFDVPDEGIWEVRGGARHFLFSKLLMWLAVDLGIRLVERHDGADAVPAHWRSARAEMRRRIETEGIDAERGVFTQAFGTKALDAAALQLPNVGFLPPDDPRVLATIEAIDEELGVNGHIYRYRTDDGLEGEEGAFVFCTLWMVVALARSGQLDRARERFELVLSQANDLGLLAEELDPHTGEQLGNFPQAFSHVGVISAALAIDAAEKHEPGWTPSSMIVD
ncbi:MAG: glycoside hydrolase family 15 protein [Candidatus Limnocylindrales bacterium]